VALLGSFANTGESNTCFVFTEDGVFTPKSVGEAAAHEAGHTFGLEHHSLYDANGQKLDDYSPGTPDVAPIMGVSYYSTRGLWDNGPDSDGANVLQDDLAIISSSRNGFGYRADDYGSTFFSAPALTASGGKVTASGVIEHRTDVDAFRFTSAGGTVQVSLNPAQYGPLLDGTVKLLDPFGDVLGQADTASLGESFSVNVPGGSYVILVSSAGGYGDLGQYSISATLPGGSLPGGSDHFFVQGTDFDDNISITVVDSKYQLDVNGDVQTIDPATIKQFDVLSGGGNDVVTIGTGVPGTYVLAGSGSDTVIGGDFADTINGSGGNDLIFGGGANDRLSGSAGRDQLYGGGGRDRLYGDQDNDVLVGGSGVDRMWGGSENDVLSGETSDDKLYGEGGNDTLYGGAGSDLINGGDGLDTVYAGDGNDVMYVRDNMADYVNGGAGTNSAQVDDTLDSQDSLQTLLA
jgi:Ca2+-binding RTX toxin-like protein